LNNNNILHKYIKDKHGIEFQSTAQSLMYTKTEIKTKSVKV